MGTLVGPAVKPWVRSAYDEISTRFGVSTTMGNPSTGKPDHLAGLALDFMVFSDRAKGESIAQYAIANYQRLGIGYVIWWQRIWYPSKGWSQMADRGSLNANHKNHVHVNFGNSAPAGGSAPVITPAADSLNPLDALSGIGDALNWITNPHNLGRIALFLLGFGAMMIVVGRAMGASQTVKSTVKAAANARS